MVIDDRTWGKYEDNAGYVSDIEIGDTLHVAWFDGSELATDVFEVTEINVRSTSYSYDILLTNDTQEWWLNGGKAMFLTTDEEMRDPYLFIKRLRRALGVSTSRDGMFLEIVISLVQMGIPSGAALDYVVSYLEIDDDLWRRFQDKDPEAIQARLEYVQETLEWCEWEAQDYHS